MYKTIVRFVDLQDNSYLYNVGDTFPRAGKVVSDERLEELATNKNKRKMALIQKVEEVKPEEKKVEEKPVEKVEVVEKSEKEEKKATPKKAAKSSSKKQK